MTSFDIETLTAEERAGYLLSEYAEATRRLRALRARQADGERIFYLIEAEGITQCEIRRDLRKLGLDASALLRGAR